MDGHWLKPGKMKVAQEHADGDVWMILVLEFHSWEHGNALAWTRIPTRSLGPYTEFWYWLVDTDPPEGADPVLLTRAVPSDDA